MNVLSFDQNGSVILMVTNSSKAASNSSLEFINVSNCRIDLVGLLGTAILVLNVSANKGSVPICVEARDTLVLETPHLRWRGPRARSGAQALQTGHTSTVAVVAMGCWPATSIADQIVALDKFEGPDLLGRIGER